MRGIAAYGAYVPYWRLDRKAIATALGAPSGSGTRSVASYDEDTTSLGVEAARAAVRAAPHLSPQALYFATVQPAYLDKTNATAIHAALDLAPSTPAYDMVGAVRSGAAALGGPHWRCSPTSGRGFPAAPMSARAVTAPSRSSALTTPTTRRCSPSRSA